ncbi:hypothetical protein [Salinispira pacifica]|uniref:Uncharacterized protein n=1 Tax=Salinispira pacifica TaxID=1307761 RepID=V5WHF3_9SPIO|nr:hypothetical protein [Salinispira pacifica]AHC14979.1 hypothetical protein L21SP2_1592 [Salinispira pacifica]
MVYDIPVNEKRDLLKQTLMTQGFHCDSEDEWNALLEHIEVHKYFASEHSPSPVNWHEAVFSWMEEVYEPLLDAVKTPELHAAFPDVSSGSLLFAISSHWYYLKQSKGEVSAADAARDYSRKFGKENRFRETR